MKPSWKDAPPKAKWLAMDADGKWFWYETKPSPFVSRWISLKVATGDRKQPWHLTLEKRPKENE